MKSTLANAAELLALDNHGCIASQWVRGSGNYIQARPIPIHCRKIKPWEVDCLPHGARRRAIKLFEAHPRAQAIVLVVDVDSLQQDLAAARAADEKKAARAAARAAKTA